MYFKLYELEFEPCKIKISIDSVRLNVISLWIVLFIKSFFFNSIILIEWFNYTKKKGNISMIYSDYK